ncbi:MAG: MCE family protein [Aeromicrobium sp.]
MTSFMKRFAGLSKFLTVFVLLALIVAGIVALSSRGGSRYVTVQFAQANSLYKGSDVRILGVPVGQVVSLKPKGDVVEVKMSYEGKFKLPDDVKAAIVSPSIVGDRFVQLSPAYQGGAVLPNNAILGVKRSAVPVELDQVYSSISDLTTALGPQGANKNGSLSRLIDNTAKSFDGQGAQFNETIKNFSKLSATLSDNKEELFGSLTEVETFVSTLKKNDTAVRNFNDSTARVSKVLAGERDDLSATLKALSLALIDVKGFIAENRTSIRGNVDNLAVVSDILANNQASLTELIKSAPTALSNVAFAYNAKYGALDNRANMAQLIFGSISNPTDFLCGLLGQSSADPICGALGGILGGLPPVLPKTPASAKLPATPTLPGLPRTSIGSSPHGELVNDSVREMLAVNR